ncbi:LptA/OstA family protein [Sphingomonas quercus]|uniref:LptA/OstA family protein n=1 Tax=Sphingomonas quercus TaxID=2842451 RepID=A0ABS6BI77_9SPHN|nr:LptA/OstA family protein [Sphingomonas quercus]MBU3078018.1 LptA/OstA family protein [Sphingomonas quercus]
MIRRLALLGTLILAAAPALGQGIGALKGHDSDAPVDVSSDHLEVQDKANRAILTGNVRAQQGDLSLAAPRMTAAYLPGQNGGDPQIQRLDASGGVTLVSPSETARSSFAIYDLNRRIITMIGGVTLTRGTNKVSGGRMVYDLNSGRATMDGSAVGGGSAAAGGRVTGRFTVPKRQDQPQSR